MNAIAIVPKEDLCRLSKKAQSFYDVMVKHLEQERFQAAAQAFRYFRCEVQVISKKIGNIDTVGPLIKFPGLVLEGYISELRKNEGNGQAMQVMRIEGCECIIAMAKAIIKALNA